MVVDNLQEEVDKVLAGFSEFQIEAYKRNLYEFEDFFLESGHLKAELAIIGYLLFDKYKTKCIELHKISDNLNKTIEKAEELLKTLKDKNEQ